LHPSQRFECPPFSNSLNYEIRRYGIEVTFSGKPSTEFNEIYQFVEKLLVGNKRQAAW
jgi:hypothetical protein